MASLRKAPQQVDEYTEEFAREIVERVKVINTENLLVVFKGEVEIGIGITGA